MTMEIPLWNSPRPALVDDCHAHLVKWRWRLNAFGYVMRHCELRVGARILRKQLLSHAVLGYPEPGFVVDHISRDKLDNRRANLRFVTAAENRQNVDAYACNITGVRGVTFRRDTGRYLAAAQIGGHLRRLGYFDTVAEADAVVRAYRAKNMPFSEDARYAIR